MSLAQTVADGLHLLDEQAQLLVESSSPLGDQPRILLLSLLAPQIIDGAQGHQQVGGADQQYVVVEGVLGQGRISLQHQLVGGLDGHEHQDVVEGLELELLVALASQLAHMVAYRGHMLLEGLLARLILFGIEIALVRR